MSASNRRDSPEPRAAMPKGRRRFLKLAAAALMTGCSRLDASPSAQAVLSWFDRWNHKAGLLLEGPHRLARTYPPEAATPEQMRPNGSIVNPSTRFLRKPGEEWRLALAEMRLNNGRLEKKYWVREYTMAELRAMPSLDQTVEHHCVEGWSAICRWRGVALAHLLSLHPLKPESRYVHFICDDMMPTARGYERYNVTFDLKSARHPQNVLVYEYNGETLPFLHGAPLRLAAPTHVGWKSAKYIRYILLMNEDMGGYWEDQGYPRYYGF